MQNGMLIGDGHQKPQIDTPSLDEFKMCENVQHAMEIQGKEGNPIRREFVCEHRMPKIRGRKTLLQDMYKI